jgi:radical SAM enzyme (TIGR01210 family)
MSGVSDLIMEIRARGLKAMKLSHKTKHQQNPRQYISAWIEDDVLKTGGPVSKALVVILNTVGCSWSRAGPSLNQSTSGDSNVELNTQNSVGGGCSMCGYINDCITPEINIQNQDYLFQLKSALEKFKNEQFQFIKIFTSGSFLDDHEVPFEVQKDIMKLCNEHSITNLLFESRPEFITLDRLDELSTIFSGKLQVAIGLESANDYVLKYSINKGFTFDDYCTAVQNARKSDLFVKTYLLLKPLFLTEFDAISDVLHSIQILRDKRLTDSISINPVNIQKFTLIEYLFHRNDYRPPWLWSVVEVLDHGHEILNGSNIRLISAPTAGGKRYGAHNCGVCDATVLNTIAEFSLNNDRTILQKNGFACDCEDTWSDILKLERITKNNIFEFRRSSD